MTLRAQCCAFKRGMVLLEVVMALTFFAVCTLGLIVALNSSMDTSRDRHAIVTAQRGLENQLALVRGAALAPGETDTTDEQAGLLYHIAVVPEPMQDQNRKPILGLYRVTITVNWKQDGRAESRQISQLFYQP